MFTEPTVTISQTSDPIADTYIVTGLLNHFIAAVTGQAVEPPGKRGFLGTIHKVTKVYDTYPFILITYRYSNAVEGRTGPETRI